MEKKYLKKADKLYDVPPRCFESDVYISIVFNSVLKIKVCYKCKRPGK